MLPFENGKIIDEYKNKIFKLNLETEYFKINRAEITLQKVVKKLSFQTTNRDIFSVLAAISVVPRHAAIEPAGPTALSPNR